MKRDIAKQLLEIKAVFLSPNEPFTWASGIKSPIYCDNRITMSFPTVRKNIAKGLATLIQEQYPEAEVVAGTATAGIPHAAWVSEELNLPMCYVRSKPKAHGKGNQIEGKKLPGAKVVVVEDLISTGGSVVTCVDALREDGYDVVGVVSIFTYGLEKADEVFAGKEVSYNSLTNYDVLAEVAAEMGYIAETDREKLQQWRNNPADVAWMNA